LFIFIELHAGFLCAKLLSLHLEIDSEGQLRTKL